MFSPSFKKELEEALLQEKAKIEEDLSRFTKRNAKLAGGFGAVFPKFGDRAADQDENTDEVEEYEKILSLEHALEKRLEEIAAALAKLPAKEFGICEKCGKQIPKERLRANPAATTCLKC